MDACAIKQTKQGLLEMEKTTLFESSSKVNDREDSGEKGEPVE